MKKGRLSWWTYRESSPSDVEVVSPPTGIYALRQILTWNKISRECTELKSNIFPTCHDSDFSQTEQNQTGVKKPFLRLICQILPRFLPCYSYFQNKCYKNWNIPFLLLPGCLTTHSSTHVGPQSSVWWFNILLHWSQTVARSIKNILDNIQTSLKLFSKYLCEHP